MRGNGRIFARKETSVLWCAYYLRGKEYRESTGTADRKQAEKFLKRRLKETGADEIGARSFVGPQQERIKIGQLCDALAGNYRMRGKESTQFTSNLARVREYFGEMRAVALTHDAVSSWINQLRSQVMLQLLATATRNYFHKRSTWRYATACLCRAQTSRGFLKKAMLAKDS